MEIDKTTLNDLAIFDTEEAFSVFSKLNFSTTSNGRDQLKKNLTSPLGSIEAIKAIQQTLQLIISKEQQWPQQISNGTIMVIERFFEATLDPIPGQVSSIGAYSYKLLHNPDYSLAKYSAGHCIDFIKGMMQLQQLFPDDNTAQPLKKVLQDAGAIIKKGQFNYIDFNVKTSELPIPILLQLAHFLRYHFKAQFLQLLQLHAQLDAWYGMAMAVKKYHLAFPTFRDTDKPFLDARGLYHVLLDKPVAYDTRLNQESNFLFLTGANMAGKSTFIKSVGLAAFLAHLGMGVPAASMELSYFDGMLSNINVIDNISKGESYFFNEVQRIKSTIGKINDGRKWLILIDELFKGTNVQDAMKCSIAVIEGLLKIRNSLFILSTHLYEIGEALQKHDNIHFSYFETSIHNGQLSFNYQLREGISSDRFGYLILKKEGVVDMLEKL